MEHLFEEDFKAKVLESDIPVLVDVFGTWCGPCRALKPVLEDLEKKYQDQVKFIKADADECQEFVENFNIRMVPTVLLFKNGDVVDQFSGFKPADKIIEFIDKNI